MVEINKKEEESRDIFALAEKLGIPVIFSNVNELCENFILFAKTPDVIADSIIREIKFEYLEKVIRTTLKKSNQKIVFAYKACSGPFYKNILNDPEKLRFLMDNNVFPKEELWFLLRMKEKYKDRFEIEPIGVPEENVNFLSYLLKQGNKELAEDYERWVIEQQVPDLYLRCILEGVKVFIYMDVENIFNILKNIEKEKENIDKKDVTNICILLPPKIDISVGMDGEILILITTGKPAKILPGGIPEFVHEVVEQYGLIYLRIPINEVKDIDSAIKIAEDGGFNAKVTSYDGYRYLGIYKDKYYEKDDKKVVEKLKEIAIKISKEDYLKHIEGLEFSVTRVVRVIEIERERYFPLRF